METPVLELIDVHKRYAQLTVLDGLSLCVQPGEVFGFLGKNGAGKSTAIRAMMGIIGVDAGEIRLFGTTLQQDLIPLRRRVGYVAQEQHFYSWMSPVQLGKFVGGFYPQWNPARYHELLDSFSLPLKRKLGAFSGGMKAKLALAVALSTVPELLILDEPTAGMDPIARREFLQLVREQAAFTGASVFFSTHLIDDIEAVAGRIGIVENGRCVYEGELTPLTKSVATFSVELTQPDANLHFRALAPAAIRCLTDRSYQNERSLVLQFGPSIVPSVVENCHWQQQPMTLEDVFVALVSAAPSNNDLMP